MGNRNTNTAVLQGVEQRREPPGRRARQDPGAFYSFVFEQVNWGTKTCVHSIRGANTLQAGTRLKALPGIHMDVFKPFTPVSSRASMKNEIPWTRCFILVGGAVKNVICIRKFNKMSTVAAVTTPNLQQIQWSFLWRVCRTHCGAYGA